MEKTVELVAIAEIIGLGESRLVATGDFEADGTPRFRRESTAIRPGTSFTTDGKEAERLILARAAALAGSEAAAHAVNRGRETAS
jgi:hypothetical protein